MPKEITWTIHTPYNQSKTIKEKLYAADQGGICWGLCKIVEMFYLDNINKHAGTKRELIKLAVQFLKKGGSGASNAEIAANTIFELCEQEDKSLSEFKRLDTIIQKSATYINPTIQTIETMEGIATLGVTVYKPVVVVVEESTWFFTKRQKEELRWKSVGLHAITILIDSEEVIMFDPNIGYLSTPKVIKTTKLTDYVNAFSEQHYKPNYKIEFFDLFCSKQSAKAYRKKHKVINSMMHALQCEFFKDKKLTDNSKID
ncbi:hypothetical protein [Candidatus Sneabacter namystus]|uniref:Uncharacterized protein n=1 Tax=Candidatus Sneabacter namystus TaxID=2601646 RepID=A0A5C0UJG5_9RICK|nr:hypothetical protein [Candidatus Sneabacter namystus]QEK39653.1 hypothetical protein FZC37_01760 [Candidatus Sneabacter namystus]